MAAAPELQCGSGVQHAQEAHSAVLLEVLARFSPPSAQPVAANTLATSPTAQRRQGGTLPRRSAAARAALLLDSCVPDQALRLVCSTASTVEVERPANSS